jgi:hypothetical protein
LQTLYIKAGENAGKHIVYEIYAMNGTLALKTLLPDKPENKIFSKKNKYFSFFF